MHLPVKIIQECGNDAVTKPISLRRSAARRRRSLQSIVKKMNPASYRRRQREFSDASPMGKQIW